MFVAEHIHALLHIGKSNRLRGGHHQCSLDRDVIHQTDVDVPRSRRHVYEKEIQLTPAYLQDHLLESIAGHGTSPDESLLALREVSDGHPLHAVLLDRQDDLLSFPGLLCKRHLSLGAGHDRDRRAVDVSIGKSYLVPQTGKSDGQIDRNGGFAHPSLAGSDSDDVLHSGNLLQTEVQTGFLLRGLIPDNLSDSHLDTRKMADDGGTGTSGEIFSQRIPPFRESQGDSHLVAGDFHPADHSQFDYVLASPGRMHDLGENSKYFLFSHLNMLIHPPQAATGI